MRNDPIRERLTGGRQLGNAPCVAGATAAQLQKVEEALGLQLPSELRTALTARNGSESWFGNCYLVQYDIDALVGVNQEIEHHPGFLAFASDGSAS